MGKLRSTSSFYFDSKRAAAFLGLSCESIRKYVQRGILRPQDTIGRAYVFSREELERFQAIRRPVGRQKA